MTEHAMVKSIDTDTLRAWLDDGLPVTVLDIRTDEDRAQWWIPGSIHVNAYEALQRGEPGLLASLNLPSGAPVVTVCGAGRVSLTAADLLVQRGVDARSLAGGMKSWSTAWNTADVVLPDPRVEVIQVRRTGKGCLSYIVGSGGEALVIDPSLPPELYLDLAGRRRWRIRQVLETHVHADHISRARQLALRADAVLRIPEQHRVHFPFTPVTSGDRIALGTTTIVAHRTPGHTDESTCFQINHHAVFTGDTLFTRGVGRPDLHAEPGVARQRARALFASLAWLRSLGPDTLVLPAHTSEPVPFNGRPILASMSEIETWLPEWLASEDAFVDRLISKLPPPPPNFTRIVELNEAGEAAPGDPAELEAGANRCAVA